MRLLHTSDWHLGKTLYGQKRYEEFNAFLRWLHDTLSEHQVEVLVVAGDIFDTTTPSHKAQELYFQFLARCQQLPNLRHVIIVGGNHDSPTLLNAPKSVLKYQNIHIVGDMEAQIENEVLVLDDATGQAAMILCAVPYLRDRDLRQAEAGEDSSDKERKLVEGIAKHYRAIGEQARQQREQLEASSEHKKLPIVLTGHLFVSGSKSGEGERELYVGHLGQISIDHFPKDMDYLAMGHLHVPQKIAGQEHLRYSGSPLAMGFGEARQQKSLCLVDFDGHQARVQNLDIPRFQALEQLKGDWPKLQQRLLELQKEDSEVWLEIEYTGKEALPDLKSSIEQLCESSSFQVLSIKDHRQTQQVLTSTNPQLQLQDLSEQEVFEKLLDAHEINDEDRHELIVSFQETLQRIHEDDRQSE